MFKVRMITILIVVFGLIAAVLFPVAVSAQTEFCDLFPCDEAGGDTEFITGTQFEDVFFYITGSIFVVFILIGVFYIVKGSLKILRSEGDQSKIQEGVLDLKGVFIGITLLIVGIIGLIVLLAIFDAGGVFDQEITPPEGAVIPEGLDNTII